MLKMLEAIWISQPLPGENYPTWSRLMQMGLSAKSKLGFIDGTVTASMATTPALQQA